MALASWFALVTAGGGVLGAGDGLGVGWPIAVIALGLVGLTVDENAIDRLIERINQLAHGEYDVDFDGEDDRNNGLGRLFDAIDDLSHSLREREQHRQRDVRRFEAVFDDPNMLVGLLDSDGTLRRANETALEYVGVDREAVLGEPFPSTPWWADTPAEDVREWIDRAAAGEYVDYEASLEGSNGVKQWVTGTFRPVRDETGDVVSIIASARDLTERNAQREELKTTNARLEALFENSPDMIDVLDTGGVIVDANQRFCEEVGYAEDELVGRGIWTLDQQVTQADVEALLEEMSVGERRKFEGRYQRKDGSVFPIEVHLIRLDFEAKDRYLAMSRDINQRKERDRALRDRTRELKRNMEYTDDVLDAIDDVFYVLGADGTLQRWNSSMPEATGYTGEEIPKMNVLEFFVEDEQERIADAVAEAFETGNVRLESAIRTKRGERIPYEFVATRLKDPSGDPLVAGIARDISERVEKNRQFSRLIDNIPGLVYRTENEPGWPTEFVSEGVRDVAGYEPDALERGEISWDDITAEDHGKIWDEVQRALDARESYDFDFPIETADGERRWVTEQGRGVYAPDGSVQALEGVIIDITERVEYERELERTQCLLEQSQQLAQVGAWEIDVEDGEPADLFITEETKNIHGIPPEADLDLEAAIEFYHSEDRQRVRHAIEHVLTARESYDIEARLIDAAGDERWIRAMGSPVFDDDELVTIRGAIQDITTRKRRENALEEHTEFTDEILDAIDDVFFMLEEDATLRRWNESLRELTGYTDDELAGIDASAFFPEEHREEVSESIRTAFETGSGTIEVPYQTADGERVLHEIIAKRVTDPGGTPVVTGIARDISERDARERELERTGDLLQQVQEMADIGGWELDLRTDPPDRVWTDELYRLHGLSRETELDIETIVDCYHPDDRERLRRHIDQSFELGTGYDLEARVVTDAGETRWMNAISNPVYEDGELVKLRGSIQDITEQKARERELERTQELLQQAGRIAGFGGWELDVSVDPPAMTWSDELYTLHDVALHTDIDVETTLELYHPDDRPYMREQFEDAIERGEGYDMEVRALTTTGDVRWVRAIGEPVFEADQRSEFADERGPSERGNVVAVRGSIQDITEQKAWELALESLHEATRGLLGTETTDDIAELVVDTAEAILDVPGVGVYLLDPESNLLDPVAFTPGFVERCDSSPSAVGRDSVLWKAFLDGEQTVFEEARPFTERTSGGLVVPIGDHGAFVVAAPPATIGEKTTRLAETLVATTEAALDRLESESSLRERDAELEARNRRLRRQIQITDLIRRIDQSLIGASSRGEIETAVCEQLVEAEDIAFAWIGATDSPETTLSPRSWAGTGEEYLDTIALDEHESAGDPATVAARTASTAGVANVVEELKDQPWAKRALAHDFHSVVSVPLSIEDYFYGVLTIYGDEPAAFGELEQTVLAELGENIASSINDVTTRQALHTDTAVELTLRCDDADAFLARVAREAAVTVEYEGLATHETDESRLFFSTDGDPAPVETALEGFVAVSDYRLVSESDGRCLFEATVAGDVLASRLVRHGGRPRTISATATTLEVVVDAPVTIEVRRFVELLREQYPSVELLARRTVQRDIDPDGQQAASLFEELTDRQRDVLRTAYLAGFFEWPRESSGEDVADMLDVSQPTINRHLRLGQQRLFEQLFGSRAPSIEPDRSES